MNAISQGWEVLNKNIGKAVFLGVIQGLIYIGVGIASALVIGVFGLGEFSGSIDSSLLGLLCLALPLGLLASAILQTFQTSTWTIAFLEFTGASSSEPAA